MGVLKIDNLHICFETKKGRKIAVDGVSFDVQKARYLGLLGNLDATSL